MRWLAQELKALQRRGCWAQPVPLKSMRLCPITPAEDLAPNTPGQVLSGVVATEELFLALQCWGPFYSAPVPGTVFSSVRASPPARNDWSTAALWPCPQRILDASVGPRESALTAAWSIPAGGAGIFPAGGSCWLYSRLDRSQKGRSWAKNQAHRGRP